MKINLSRITPWILVALLCAAVVFLVNSLPNAERDKARAIKKIKIEGKVENIRFENANNLVTIRRDKDLSQIILPCSEAMADMADYIKKGDRLLLKRKKILVYRKDSIKTFIYPSRSIFFLHDIEDYSNK